MTVYKALMQKGESRYEEKKSVFYGYAFPVREEKAALSHIAAIKSRYPDARHHVYAYMLREGNLTRYSDDGEPQGTAGMPLLDLLRKEGITDTLLCVVRYFGGTLLGTGGLVRAYTTAGKAAIHDGVVAGAAVATRFTLSLSYGDYERANLLLQSRRAVVLDTDFGARISLTARIESELYPALREALTEATAARAELAEAGTEFVLFPLS